MINRDYEDLVGRVKEAVSLADMVERAGVSLNSKGMGLCPFHDEKTPSFHVDADKGMFYCHGCGVGGDAISFHMKHNSMGFVEAIEDLAERHRIPLPANFTPEQKAAISKESRRREVLTALVNYWHERARQAAPLREYLVGRWTAELVDQEKIGYAADDEAFREFIGDAKITIEELLSLGIFEDKDRNDKAIPPRLNGCLRDRIVIPDWRGGKVVFVWTRSAPGRRDIPVPHEKPDKNVGPTDNRPKYLPYATKDCHPMGGAPPINEKALAGKPKEIWLVEGVSKVLTMKQLGIENVVGLAGVSTLGKHFEKFKDVDRVWILLDTDKAGVEWSWKYARMFGARARVVELGKIKAQGRRPETGDRRLETDA